jgi:hypothetical protein
MIVHRTNLGDGDLRPYSRQTQHYSDVNTECRPRNIA